MSTRTQCTWNAGDVYDDDDDNNMIVLKPSIQNIHFTTNTWNSLNVFQPACIPFAIHVVQAKKKNKVRFFSRTLNEQKAWLRKHNYVGDLA